MSALNEFLASRGAMADLARGLGISHGAVRQWQGHCPAERVVEVERITGIPREALRPDLFRRNPITAPPAESAAA